MVSWKKKKELLNSFRQMLCPLLPEVGRCLTKMTDWPLTSGSHHVLTWQREQSGTSSLLSLLLRAPTPSRGPHPHDLITSQDPPPDTTTVGMVIPAHEFVCVSGDTTQSPWCQPRPHVPGGSSPSARPLSPFLHLCLWSCPLPSFPIESVCLSKVKTSCQCSV